MATKVRSRRPVIRSLVVSNVAIDGWALSIYKMLRGDELRGVEVFRRFQNGVEFEILRCYTPEQLAAIAPIIASARQGTALEGEALLGRLFRACARVEARSHLHLMTRPRPRIVRVRPMDRPDRYPPLELMRA